MKEMNEILERFLSHEGKIKTWPAKNKMQRLVLEYLVNQFEKDRVYNEHEVNDIIDEWHTFND